MKDFDISTSIKINLDSLSNFLFENFNILVINLYENSQNEIDYYIYIQHYNFGMKCTISFYKNRDKYLQEKNYLLIAKSIAHYYKCDVLTEFDSHIYNFGYEKSLLIDMYGNFYIVDDDIRPSKTIANKLGILEDNINSSDIGMMYMNDSKKIITIDI